jgi:hypothetical protein
MFTGISSFFLRRAVQITLIVGLEDPDQVEAPVRSTHRYLSERRNQLDYSGACDAEVPIGLAS